MACDPCYNLRRHSLSQFTDARPSTITHDDTISFHGTLDHRASEPIDMLPNKYHRTNADAITGANYTSYLGHYKSPMAYSHSPHLPMPPYEMMNTPFMQAEAGHSSCSAPPFQSFDNRSLSISLSTSIRLLKTTIQMQFASREQTTKLSARPKCIQAYHCTTWSDLVQFLRLRRLISPCHFRPNPIPTGRLWPIQKAGLTLPPSACV